MTPAPSFFHQWIILSLMQYIGIPAKVQDLAFALPAPIGVLMPGCAPIQPDFVVVLKHNAHIIYDRRIRGVPDLIIEVLSPGSTAYDMQTKLEAYARASVPEYAIIDPRARSLNHYRLETPGRYHAPRVFGATEVVVFDCLPTLLVPVDALFAGAPDTTF
jgi:Uma2 family endonuclease